jgi:hypothetical protein
MPIKYYKGEPNVYTIQYRGGEIIQHGVGLSFFYFPVTTSIAAVPIMTQDAPFIFNETTANFQDIAIQGHLTYRLAHPLNAAKILDFRIDPKTGRYRSKDPEKLQQRIVNAMQSYTRSAVNRLSLEEALTRVRDLASEVLVLVRQEAALDELGVIIESLYFTAVTATPEMKKALEAEYREGLQRRADQAIYARRAAAVEEERKIQESELGTEVGLEEKRRDLVDLQARNSLALAEVEGKSVEMKLAPYNALAPQALIGLALKEWAANAGKIGNLHITPDLLTELVSFVGGGRK